MTRRPGLTYRRTIRLPLGVRVNVDQRGVTSVSVGAGGLRYTWPLRRGGAIPASPTTRRTP